MGITKQEKKISQYSEKIKKQKRAMASNSLFNAFLRIRMTNPITLMNVAPLWIEEHHFNRLEKATRFMPLVESIKDKSLNKQPALCKVLTM